MASDYILEFFSIRFICFYIVEKFPKEIMQLCLGKQVLQEENYRLSKNFKSPKIRCQVYKIYGKQAEKYLPSRGTCKLAGNHKNEKIFYTGPSERLESE